MLWLWPGSVTQIYSNIRIFEYWTTNIWYSNTNIYFLLFEYICIFEYLVFDFQIYSDIRIYSNIFGLKKFRSEPSSCPACWLSWFILTYFLLGNLNTLVKSESEISYQKQCKMDSLLHHSKSNFRLVFFVITNHHFRY